ncbi:MAG: acyltransferase family protein [Prevotellaceae bacterium]|nr:acyltransferase family protein [Candidatus Colivivens equi]
MKKRDVSFDILKGILIYLVVLGHSISFLEGENCWRNTLFNSIYIFHMPLFIFVSGYFYYPSAFCKTDFIKKKAIRLLVPWFYWSSLTLVITFCLFDISISNGYDLLDLIFRTYTSYWYLICLFVLSILFYPVVNIGKVQSYCWLSGLLVVLFVFSLIYWDFVPYPIFKNCQVIRQVIPFALGLAYFKYGEKFNNYLKWCIVAFMIVFMALLWVKWGFWISAYCEYQKILSNSPSLIVAFAILISLSKRISSNIVGAVISWIGKYSLSIYLLHVFLFFVARRLSPSFSYSILNALLLSLIMMIMSVLVIMAHKLLLGKKSQYIGL